MINEDVVKTTEKRHAAVETQTISVSTWSGLQDVLFEDSWNSNIKDRKSVV